MITSEHPPIDLNREHGRAVHYDPETHFFVSLQWTRLFSVVVAVCLVISLGINAAQWKAERHKRVLILTPAQSGALVPAGYLDASAYRPQQLVLEHFAIVFATKHYSRIRYTVAQDYLDSLQFLDPDHKKAELTREKQEHWIEAFRDDPSAPEIRIVVNKIRLGNCKDDSCQMSIDFEKHFYLRGGEQPQQAENWTVDLAYTLDPADEMANDMALVNPIGLQIGDLRETKGFRQ